MSETAFSVRPARTTDVPGIQALIEPFVESNILLRKENVELYESVLEFRVAVDANNRIVGCGALHVLWQDLGEVRTIAVADEYRHHGVGFAIYEDLEKQARDIGLSRLFCLTFEVDFFSRQGFAEISDDIIPPEVYQEMMRSTDEGVAEFLDIARVKPNTLGNTRMLRLL
jgi:amino-acid N-acetyltransferase